MAIRHASAVCTSEPRGVNVMSYKCPRCAWFISFFVIDDVEYVTKLIEEYRQSSHGFVPTNDDWSDESEEIGRQLEALGYWGGGLEE